MILVGARVPAVRAQTQSNSFDDIPPDTISTGVLHIPGARLSPAYLWDLSNSGRVMESFPRSPPRVVSPCRVALRPCADSTMAVTFDSLQQQFSLWIGGLRRQGTPFVTLIALDSNGNPIKRTRIAVDSFQLGVRTLVSVAADSNAIKEVRIVASGLIPNFAIDDITYIRIALQAAEVIDDSVTVPNLVGLTQETALAVLDSVGLSVGMRDFAEDAGPPNLVLTQALPPGTRVARSTPVPFILSTPVTQADPTDPTIVIEPSRTNWTPWIIIAAVVLLGALAWWLFHRSPPPPAPDPPRPPSAQITARLLSTGLTDMEVSLTEAAVADIPITFSLDVQSSYTITFADDLSPPSTLP